MRFIILLLTSILLLSGCSWLGNGDDEKKKSATEGFTEKDFYDSIQRNLNSQNWTVAIENLQSLEAQFPFGNYAEQAQLELIYAYHKSADYEAAIAAADRFIRLHPRHPNVDYAYYIKGLSAFVQTRGFFDQYLPIDETKRDPGGARDAFATFNELITRYPESAYAADARQRMVHLRNLLARQEIHVANYYFKRGSYLAAVNRGRFVVENFQLTPSVPDGLAVMAQGYHLLQMQDLADDAARVLAANYSDHPSLDKNGAFLYQKRMSADNQSWLKRLSLGYYVPEKAPEFDSRPVYNPTPNSPPPDAQAPGDADSAANPEAAPKTSWWHWLTFGIFK